MRRILHWEEDEEERDILAALLADEYLVRGVGTPAEAEAAAAEEGWDLVILGAGDPVAGDAAGRIRLLKARLPSVPLVCRLPAGDPARTTALLREGAAACVSRDCPGDELKAWLRRVRSSRSTEPSCREPSRPYGEPDPDTRILLGESDCIRGVRRRIRLFARYDFPVLITGESGTGKDLAARSIHGLSRRASRPFLAVNCGAIPESILESELFGTERGAYTGAVSRPGTFETADGGTLFLDEITELSPGAQAKLLRILENGEIRRLGARSSSSCDVRLISATNVELDRFQGMRFDLLERLETLVLKLPPLRERLGDIPLLARHFLDQAGLAAEIGPDAMELLSGYDWPGNVRQLRNAICRAAVAASESEGGIIRAEHVDFGCRPSALPRVRAE
ncbi:MAG TPA: sigma 54-interacting transcriptional regulator [Spirochaetia bacterium]|nr:sigma 54-interacting transcriptional regulator [Spirochaetales bacterium]HRY80544.1 sigma 54-interacting transcriptional regulator [Spirochaetia bacterium]HRZ89227.1 sigma 54-interacting transcriptional regulator [Spirochaetia bacterium]